MDLQFGHYRLKRAERVLLGPDGPVELSARAFDILDALLGRPDQVVDKSALFDAVWPGLVVEENTLQVHVSALRKALPPDMIRTVHGRGYKYAGPKPSIAPAEAAETAAPSRPSIAILPFENMSGDPEQDYFSDGITEDIIARLGRFREFLVIARNSSFQLRGKANDVAEVAKRLGVQFVVEGSVRKIGNRVRVAVQLTDAVSMAHLWGEHYDRQLDDIFAIQDEITQVIAARLARQARTASRGRARPTGNMSAYDFYLRALQLAAVYDPTVGAEPLLLKALELDPDFAGARAMLGFVETIKYYWSYDPGHLDIGLGIANEALRLDPDEAYGHLATGFALMFMRRFREAETSLDRAVGLNPNDPFILSIRALLLNYVGRYDAALAELAEAQRRDPFAVGWFDDFLGITLTNAGRYRDALASFARMATLPTWSRVYVTICHAELGETDAAAAAWARVRASYPQWPDITLDGILKEEIIQEDPAIFDRYRPVLERVERSAVREATFSASPIASRSDQ
ncbi:MAG: winged helix-turn-helix domain-containing protein [Rhizobiaceae bacterium]|nr:winged helix-turn-helix domain-containing protein [Rhizobiaceae bacterium]